MVIEFENKKIAEICNDGNLLRKMGGKENHITAFQILMVSLESMEFMTTEDFWKSFNTTPSLKKYKLHKLTGDKNGQLSFRIGQNIRVVCRLIDEKHICIMEVSKHYGD